MLHFICRFYLPLFSPAKGNGLLNHADMQLCGSDGVLLGIFMEKYCERFLSRGISPVKEYDFVLGSVFRRKK